MSQKRLAQLLGVDPTTIRDWEHKKHKPISKSLRKIDEFLGET
jgi:ribosome-binding protein aMBF1 (putative translation factor)